MKFKLVENYDVLTESSLNRIISGHNTDGYVILSASRQDCLKDKIENPTSQQIEDENNIRTKNLKNDISNLHYSYIPVYGGYKEEGSEEASVEKSFIVFPYNKETTVDFDKFKNDMIDLGNKYNQDTILIKEPNRNPQYFDTKTFEWVGKDFGNVSLKDAQKEYFTSLKQWKDTSLNRKENEWNKYPQRFTYEESYLDEPPMSIMSAHSRASSGELFSMKHYK